MAAMLKCLRCKSTEHTTASCTYSFFRTTCALCNKVCKEVSPDAPKCKVVRAQEFAAWKERDAAYKAKQEQKMQRKLLSGPDAGSDDGSEFSTRPPSELVKELEVKQQEKYDQIMAGSRNACLALSELEEREARKIERKLKDIDRLQRMLDQGGSLDKLQLAKIQTKDSLESLAVMKKIFAGAQRPTI